MIYRSEEVLDFKEIYIQVSHQLNILGRVEKIRPSVVYLSKKVIDVLIVNQGGHFISRSECNYFMGLEIIEVLDKRSHIHVA